MRGRLGLLRLGWWVGLLLTHNAHAHQMQSGYALVEAEVDSVRAAVTLDVADLDRALHLDSDGSGQVEAEELRARLGEVQDFITSKAEVRRNGQPVRLLRREVGFSVDSGGHLLIRQSFAAPITGSTGSLGIKVDVFTEFGTDYRVLARLVVGDESRDDVLDPSRKAGEFVLARAPAKRLPPISFVRLGVKHIFIGIDHILFLIALIVIGGRFLDLVKIVTSFTVAHSVTLALAALQLVNPPSRFIEAAIAGSIVYVGVENFFVTRSDRRWMITGFFGLVHGFGFASVLRELVPEGRQIVSSLLAFNVGVELGQMAIVALAWPLVLGVARAPRPRRIVLMVSALVAAAGLYWFIERAFGIDLPLL